MENSFLSIDKQVVAEIYTSSEPMDNLEVLCDVYGSRWPGTPGDFGSVKYMVEKLKSYGIENAHFESYKIPGWLRGPSKLEVIEPIKKAVECISLPHGLKGVIEANLVDLGDGPIEIYEIRKQDIEDNVVMVTNQSLAGTRRIHRKEKFRRSVLVGAKGWIFVNGKPGYGPITGGVNPVIPSVGISYEDGCYLSRLVKRYGKVKVRITTTDKNVEVEAYNVVCDIHGTSDDEKYVIAGAHYDGHDISQGADDSGSGAATIIEIARVLNLVKNKLKRRIRLICFGAEEIGILGSYNYVVQHEKEMDNCMFMLNLDSAGDTGKKGVIIHDHPELEPFMAQAAREMKAEMPLAQNMNNHSDHWAFTTKGIPTASGGDPTPRTTPRLGYPHTKYDTLDKISLEYLRNAAANYSRLLIRVANIDDWPAIRKTETDIEESMLKMGINETVALRTRLKNHVRTWKDIHPDTQEWLKRKSD